MITRWMLSQRPLFIRKLIGTRPKRTLQIIHGGRPLQQHTFLSSSTAHRIIGPSSYGLNIELPVNKSYVQYMLERFELFGDRDAIVSM